VALPAELNNWAHLNMDNNYSRTHDKYHNETDKKLTTATYGHM